jgi:RNA polymerase sigma factor (sigma-70 family)
MGDTVNGVGAPNSAIDTLVENHRTFLRFLERRVGSKETAEDLLQEAFGRAVTHMSALHAGESMVAWFYRLLRNAVIDHHRRNAAAGRALERFASELEGSVPPPEVATEVCACVVRLAATLKPTYATRCTTSTYAAWPSRTTR